MDIFTKGPLWDYWKIGSDEIEPTDEGSSDLEDTNSDDEQEISEIFRIETNLFNYDTPLCEKFKEFSYLLMIDLNVLTKDIAGFKTYEEYKDDWNKDVPWVDEKPWANNGSWKEPEPDSKLKREALKNEVIMKGMIDDNDESSNDGWRKWGCYEIANHDHEESEHENEHEDEEKCELFDDREFPGLFEKEIDDVGEVSTIWKSGSVGVLKSQNVIIEYLVKINKKARILELKQRHFEDYYSDTQYAVSIKEDTAYLCLYFTKDHEGNKINTPYPEKTYMPYSRYRM
ncbi:hypothetical protein Tco_0137917 [Tanacetum coccineum]